MVQRVPRWSRCWCRRAKPSTSSIVLATLTALMEEGELDVNIVERAMSELEINTDKPNPMRL